MSQGQRPSAFRLILSALVERVGARAAALVDAEGETVDYATREDPYLVRIAAAHLRIVFGEAGRRAAFDRPRWIVVRAARARFVVYGLPDGYAVVLCLPCGTDLVQRARRALSDCALRLAEEAGWSRAGMDPWRSADVKTGERGRPAAVASGDGAASVEVLGRLTTGLEPGERGWRVRFRTGAEATLIRDRAGCWYADEPFEGAVLEPFPSRSPSSRQTR